MLLPRPVRRILREGTRVVPNHQTRTILLLRLGFVIAALLGLHSIYLDTSFTPAPPLLSALPPSLRNEKIFIVAIFRNAEGFLRDHWNESLLKLVQGLGYDNVFVSVLESASSDDTKGVLRELEEKLNAVGVGNRIVLGMTEEEHLKRLERGPVEGEEQDDWIFTGRNAKQGWELRRINHLAKLRNQAMAPLYHEASGIRFDRVLWINDVIFTVSLGISPIGVWTPLLTLLFHSTPQPEDVFTLLGTRNGNYAAACALDFEIFPDRL